MSWNLVPLLKRDFGFFDRQRDLFSDWVKEFDDEWKSMDFESSRSRFDRELERIRKDMFKLDTGSSMLSIEKPFVTDPVGNKKLSLRFDCSQFKPEEISVKTMDKRLCVHAKHTEESPGRKVYREFTKEYTLPNAIDPLRLTSILSKDGVLQIEAPAPASVDAPREFLIPIEKL
jgi:HSP20 family molecular chaperone IbpA|uniref:Heat shock protein 22 isoform 1 n=1 Tax=Ruditapes philippinarum TaxID=129788 RepID=C8CBN4_RUDPH|nr:heat shock protein 22 isoform 1 [Ruditapes philippinarum]